jgi:hypothetical protein
MSIHRFDRVIALAAETPGSRRLVQSGPRRPFASVSVSGDDPELLCVVTAEARARTTKEQPLTGAVAVGLGLAFL